ncbi:tRNA epoxyqueuosine(34) reductase QueG [Sediminibacterium sp. TEGAF015]|uniref:tRNA epoxyqueuosine(34) reductase QueG n=1 Tax=Sediminibacterium sp. TEGAF015 TaxID=575378 RepID=UPI002230A998|nr:tRNA epoxyqueuosine(34) reductase QueG [Sediminibacterium sp. TEGAF015]
MSVKMLSVEANTRFIKAQAARLGFSYCGIAKAEKLNEDARRLEQWLNKNHQGSMQYMENHFDKRIDPTLLVPGAQSVITLLKNYYPDKQQQNNSPKIARYAWGKDYHEVIRAQLKELLAEINQEIGTVNGRGFVDSAPVLERAWAVKSGLGWVGKNGNLISKQNGSYFFIATLIVDLPLLYDDPYAKDYCGTCTQCIDACPTDAILPNKEINGSQCISYYTIELKEALSQQTSINTDNWLFGCDICQEVCPWNRFSKPHQEPAFAPIPVILNLTTQEWEEMTEEVFNATFKESPLKRSKYSGIRRNLQWL